MENENINFTELVEATEVEETQNFDLNKILEIIDKVSGIVERLSKKKEENQQINKVSTIIHRTETENQQEQNINVQNLVNEYIKNNNTEITKNILLNNFDLFFNKIKEILKEQSEKNGDMTLKQLNNLLNTFENIAKTKGKEYIKNIEVL